MAVSGDAILAEETVMRITNLIAGVSILAKFGELAEFCLTFLSPDVYCQSRSCSFTHMIQRTSGDLPHAVHVVSDPPLHSSDSG